MKVTKAQHIFHVLSSNKCTKEFYVSGGEKGGALSSLYTSSFYPFFFPPSLQLIGPCSIHHPLQYSPSHISPLSPSPCHQSCSEMIMYLGLKIPNIQTMSDQMIDYLICQFLHSITVRGHRGATPGNFLEFTFNLVPSAAF